MYVGDDPAGAQTSGVFGGSENVKGYIDDNHVNIRKMLSDYTTVLRWVFVPNQSHILSQLSLVIAICKENPTQLRVLISTLFITVSRRPRLRTLSYLTGLRSCSVATIKRLHAIATAGYWVLCSRRNSLKFFVKSMVRIIFFNLVIWADIRYRKSRPVS